MKIFFYFRTLSLFTLMILFSSQSLAQLRIEIRQGVERPIQIAVVPFTSQSLSSSEISNIQDVIQSDLINSGRFTTLPQESMLSRPILPSDVDFNDWRILDIDALVIGRIISSGQDQFTIHFQLFDVLRGEQLLAFRLLSDSSSFRSVGHKISDMIFAELTGITGIFNTKVAYISQLGVGDTSRYRLIVSDIDGENPQIIADSPQPLMSPSWSPDGTQLAYVSFEQDKAAIYIQNIEAGTRTLVSDRLGINGAPSFSPDGRYLALALSRDTGNLDIYMLNIDGQVLTRLTRSPSIDTEPAWSPDGQVIYFTSDRSGNPQIYKVDTRLGGNISRVTFEGTYNARPRLSPDGNQLAVVHRGANNNYRIALVDIESGLTQVLSGGYLDESPSFSPNGSQIIFATRENGSGVLSSVSTDGRIRRKIASVVGDVREPVWSPSLED
ncbi:MAG: Tol-Pal system beta propeller repeat protein TolB [Gammaproteobacteria bacterium TMED78]|nr:MAG: Tol-Pal system beta propeller repeat protein TolB [Gammaproteobacteria bacterium TMED78]